MLFKSIKIHELPEFINSDLFKQSKNIPITSIRAISHSKNPRADKDDISLIICISSSNEIIGYIGILPDKFYNNQKAGWLSCWWTDDNEGKKAGLHLFLMAVKSWDNKFIITDFTPQIKDIIKRTRLFTFAAPMTGIRGFLRFNTEEVLPGKFRFLSKLKFILKAADKIANVFVNIRFSMIKSRYSNSSIIIDNPDTIDNEISTFINSHNENEYIKRGSAELNWILNNPWVHSKSESTNNLISESKEYYFSSISKIFTYHKVKLSINGKMIAFIMFRQRDQEFSVPYIYFDQDNIIDVVNFIYSYIIENNANTLTIYHPVISSFMRQNKNPFFYLRDLEKDFAVSNDMKDILSEDRILQDGDGDYVFT